MPDTDTSLPQQMDADAKFSEIYNESFYEHHAAISLQSARIYLKFLWQFSQPVSVLDVGCGRGAWLKACHELGSKTLLGLDGGWNTQSSMIDSAINFHCINLNEPFSIPQKVDLAMSLEVAEHLEHSTAPIFVKCLTDASDVVMFSAAYTEQGGDNHINEQPHTFWAGLFSEHGFLAFDIFRPVFWGNKEVDFCYRQNVFIYVKKDSAAYRDLSAHGFPEPMNISFMDCIHPDLYNSKIAPPPLPSFRSHVRDLMPSAWRAIKRRWV